MEGASTHPISEGAAGIKRRVLITVLGGLAGLSSNQFIWICHICRDVHHVVLLYRAPW